MAVPSSFEVVQPRSQPRSSQVLRRGVLVFSACLAAVALIAMSQSSDEEPAPQSNAQTQLVEMPGISLGIRAHEQLGQPAPAVAKPAAQQALSAGAMKLDHHAHGRWNYQMDNKLTWPPHDTRYIPTGAYSAGYKGPYDNDYDWPDDTQVLRNDEWDMSGGIGCGMNGNNC